MTAPESGEIRAIGQIDRRDKVSYFFVDRHCRSPGCFSTRLVVHSTQTKQRFDAAVLVRG